MWTRKELKSRAREALKRYYWMAVLVCFLGGLLGSSDIGGGYGTAAVSGATEKSTVSQYQTAAYMADDLVLEVEEIPMSQSHHEAFNRAAMTILFGVLGLVVVVVSALVFFVGNVVRVGMCRYFMESRWRKASAGVDRLFFAFRGGRYWNVVKTMFLQNLFVMLWTFVFIIPGLVKAYQYYMVPYILAENPDMNWREVLDLSRDMMREQKWSVFVLDLSFMGWEILGSLLCGIGMLFVTPYIEATFAELYGVLRTGAEPGLLKGFEAEPENC